MKPDSLVDNAVSLIHIIQKGMTDEQRLNLWERIKEGYCDTCARKLDRGEKCFCFRD